MSKQQLVTESGLFKINKAGKKHVDTTLYGILREYKATLLMNDVLADVVEGECVFLMVEDISVKSQYGTKMMFEVKSIVHCKEEINRLLMKERVRVANIYINAAEENLVKGWYSGSVLEKALVFTASHPELKEHYKKLRVWRLRNVIDACNRHTHKNDHYLSLCQLAGELYEDEKSFDAEIDQHLEIAMSKLNDSALSVRNEKLNEANAYKVLLQGMLRTQKPKKS